MGLTSLKKDLEEKMTNTKKFIEQWKKDEKAHFEGWDFSYLKGRITEESPTWSYPKLAKGLVKKSKSLLEMAIGGGEIFSSFAPFPKKTIAIEGYEPNVAVARKRMRKFGVRVIYANESKKLPFDDEQFDLILNRHGALNCKEIARVLKSKGILLTQQVGGNNVKDLMIKFDAKPKWLFNNLRYRTKELKSLGFKIKMAKSWKGKLIFKDIGAIVYWLKAIPWVVDNFSVKSHLNYLFKLQKEIEKKKRLVYTYERFLILAEKK